MPQRVPNQFFEECGLELSGLFGPSQVAFRPVESKLDNTYEFVLTDYSVFVWSHLLPPALHVGDWLRFERRESAVEVSLDVRKTEQAAARLTSLLAMLTPCEKGGRR